MASLANNNTITLKSKDGEEFVVSRKVAMVSRLISLMIRDDEFSQQTIPIPNVNAAVLEKVIMYCEKHVDAASNTNTADEGGGIRKMSDKELDDWEQEFLSVDQDSLFELIMAAHYMDISFLYKALCKKVVNMIKGKSPEEIRQTLNIANDFTTEEQEEISRKNRWAFM